MAIRANVSKVRKQSGVALISVLLAVALCTILAAEMLMEQTLQVRRAQNLFERQQAYWYAMGSEQFVKGLLSKTSKDDKGVFKLDQSWAMESMSFPVDDGLIEGKITDLNACFNLNALYDKKLDKTEREKRQKLFVRYLTNLDLTAEMSEEDLTNNIIDWLDKDDYPLGAVGFDGDMYASLDFPYLAANSPMATESELRVVQGFDTKVMYQLKDKFCVIPDSSLLEINVNTITEDNSELLAAMLDIDNDKAGEIVAARPEEGFENVSDFWALKEVSGLKNIAKIDKKQFTVKSKFFRLVTNAHFNDVRFDLTSVLQLDGNHAVYVVARRFGGRIERKADPETEQSNN